MINKDKYSVLFSKNTNNVAKEEFMATLDLPQGLHKYLSLPVYMGKSKAKIFSYLSMEAPARMEGKIVIPDWQRNFDKICGSGNSSHMPCHALILPRVYVMKLAQWCVVSGGRNRRRRTKFTGCHGKLWQVARRKEDSATVIYTCSTSPC
jgi:hypothetical protein